MGPILTDQGIDWAHPCPMYDRVEFIDKLFVIICKCYDNQEARTYICPNCFSPNEFKLRYPEIGLYLCKECSRYIMKREIEGTSSIGFALPVTCSCECHGWAIPPDDCDPSKVVWQCPRCGTINHLEDVLDE